MGFHRHLIAGTVLAALVAYTPAANAQDSGSMQVGGATVAVGVGTALLTLPDAPSIVTLNELGFPDANFIGGFKFSDELDEEIGLNVNGSVEVPMGANKTVSLNGFWANIEEDNSFNCAPTAAQRCIVFPLFDDPAIVNQTPASSAGSGLVSNAERDVDIWGVSLEAKRRLDSGVMGVTQAPPRRYFAVAADIRGINQDLVANILFQQANRGPVLYTEDLDTRYYGGYVAWGGDYNPLLFKSIWERLGLQSSFQLRGGVYYADTDYEGRITDLTVGFNAGSALSLSNDDGAFIGGIILETKKRFGLRATLSLKSEYEYYSYVPEMAYNQMADGRGVGAQQAGTHIGDDDAFSARTSLRLTIKLGPDSVFEEPLK